MTPGFFGAQATSKQRTAGATRPRRDIGDIVAPSPVLRFYQAPPSSRQGLAVRHTLRTEFSRHGKPHFTTVGWPGYAGALSGMAHGRFAITLNAVLSDDPPQLAPPMTFLLRDVLDTAKNFDEAVSRLRNSHVASDSLLLVTGTRPGEMVVIERSPMRAAVRKAKDGILVVSNDYLSLPASGASVDSELAATSCRRQERAEHLARECQPKTSEECFRILGDRNVRMNITVQSMVFQAASGMAEIRLPPDA